MPKQGVFTNVVVELHKTESVYIFTNGAYVYSAIIISGVVKQREALARIKNFDQHTRRILYFCISSNSVPAALAQG